MASAREARGGVWPTAAALLPQIGLRPGGSAILLAASTATDHARERGRTGRRVLSSVEGGHG